MDETKDLPEEQRRDIAELYVRDFDRALASVVYQLQRLTDEVAKQQQRGEGITHLERASRVINEVTWRTGQLGPDFTTLLSAAAQADRWSAV